MKPGDTLELVMWRLLRGSELSWETNTFTLGGRKYKADEIFKVLRVVRWRAPESKRSHQHARALTWELHRR